MTVKKIEPVKTVQGRLRLPGDKSVSHRAAILGMLAEGETRISNFLTAADCLNTLRACEQLGAKVEREETAVRIQGCGLDGLSAPAKVIDCGNSGTGVRLLAGVLAAQPFVSVITGDEQVCRRPMRRVIEPLQKMGAHIESRPGQLCPLRIQGTRLAAVEYTSPVASAQVKSCVLLAGLFADGETRVNLPAPSRDHTERMLRYFGAIVKNGLAAGQDQGHWAETQGEWVQITGRTRLHGRIVAVPSDISSAAFFMVAAALLPGSDLTVTSIGINPTRTGILDVLQKMGAHIGLENEREASGELVADIRVQGKGPLRGCTINGAGLIPRLIDELPILAVAAALAEGETVIEDAAELRVKETDRIGVLAAELRKLGVRIEEQPDGMRIHGGEIAGGAADSHGDHRLAMSLAIAGLVSEKGVLVNNPDCVNTSFPEFWQLLEDIRA